jgi:thiamine-phosphate pyrophosphorylase
VAAESCRLYLITPPRIDLRAFPTAFAKALDGGDVACVQLRLKDVPDDEVRRAADALLPIARERGVAFLINDRPDLAAATDADGVHVGQEDATYAEARRLLGPDRMIGVTCHDSRHLAMEAAEAGADYVAFGAFFPTGTKEAKSKAEPDILEWWSELFVIPSVAIGGITAQNCGDLVRAGADFLAVISAVWDHPAGPAAAVQAFNKAIEAAKK